MKAHNFLPQWYLEENEKGIKKKVFTATIIISILALIIMLLTAGSFMELKELKKSSALKKELQVMHASTPVRLQKNLSFISDYKNIMNYKSEETSYIAVDITERDITIATLGQSLQDFMRLVNAVEKDNKYRITNLSPLMQLDKRVKFTVTLTRK